MSSVLRRVAGLPPIRALLRRRHERRFHSPRGVGALCGVYDSFEAAERAIPPVAPRGYDVPGTGALYRDQLDRILPRDYPAIFWLRGALADAERVFDLGGHVGLQFYTYQNYIAYPGGLRWLVCDVPAVVRDGEALARERGETRLAFTARPEDGDGADVLLASGSLQYIPRTLDALLAGWARRPRHLVVNQMPTHPERTFVTLQHIGTSVCPYRIAARDALPAALGALGYALVDRWEDPSRRTAVPHEPAGAPIAYTGYYFRLA